MQNSVGKLLEKYVAHYVTNKQEEDNTLPPTLGSYRRGKDTWMNVAVLASDIYDSFERGEETLVVALDLEDTYNRVQYSVLLKTMIRLQVDPRLVIWIGEYLLKKERCSSTGNMDI